MGYTSLLLREDRGDTLAPQQRDSAQRVLAAARRLLTLVNDLLDLSRIEANQLDVRREDVDVAALLARAGAAAEGRARSKGLTLRWETDASVGQIATDPTRLHQVLEHLIDNALRFTTVGSVALQASRTGDAVLITVSDTGIGISAEQHGAIFDAFYQVDQSDTRQVGGTGMGLALVGRLARLLGGRISLYSTPGEGSTFTLLLPAPEPLAAIPAPDQGPARPESGRGPTHLLLVDEDPQMQVLLQRTLEGTAYALFPASPAGDALRHARALRPHAILLDVMMPGLAGWRVLHRLKADPATASIPVLIHSAGADRALALRLGAAGYLTKPAAQEDLLAALSRLADKTREPVLIVDGDEEVRSLYTALLAESEIAVLQAADGRAALQLARLAQPRVVLLDLLLPDQDGMAVLRGLRADPRMERIRVIVTTGKELTLQEETLLQEQGVPVISKAGTPLDRVLAEVRRTLEARA
jgi:CheY-like chemotaxis protein